MKDALKDALHKIESHVDTSVSAFTVANPSKTLYKEMSRKCEQSVKDLTAALKVLETKEDGIKNKEERECLMTMSFFLGKMRDESKDRIHHAIQLENSILVLASLEILRRNWAEVRSAHMRLVELTEDMTSPQKTQKTAKSTKSSRAKIKRGK